MTVDVRREAIAAVEEEMRRVVARRAKGGLVVVELDPDGDGVLLVRSGRVDRSDALRRQIEGTLRLADAAGFRVKLIVACAGVSGAEPPEERPDLVAVLEGLDDDECSWVAVCAPEWIGRSIPTAHWFFEELERRGAALYVMSLSQFERSALDPVDGHVLGLLFLLESAAFERERILERTRRGREMRRSLHCDGS